MPYDYGAKAGAFGSNAMTKALREGGTLFKGGKWAEFT